MSRSTLQSVTLLAAIGGNMYDLKRRNIPGDEATAGLVWAAYLRSTRVLTLWPKDEFGPRQKEWVSERLEQWHRLFLPDLEYYFQAQVVLSLKCLLLLSEVTRNRYKVELLNQLSEALLPLDLAAFGESMVYDEPPHEEAERLFQILKILVGWR